MGKIVKVIVTNTDLWGDREDTGHKVMTGDGVENILYDKEIWISEKCYWNLKNAIPIEHFMKEDSQRERTYKPAPRFRIEKLSDFIDEKDKPKETKKKEKVNA